MQHKMQHGISEPQYLCGFMNYLTGVRFPLPLLKREPGKIAKVLILLGFLMFVISCKVATFPKCNTFFVKMQHEMQHENNTHAPLFVYQIKHL